MSLETLSRTAQPAHQRRTHPDRPGIALAVVVTCQLMLILDATVMNVALPRIQASLGFSPAGLAWVMSAYSLSYGGLLLLGGRAGDMLGRRRLFVAGIALFTGASLLGGLATTSWWLLAARVLQGVGAAAAGPSTIALITTTVTEPRARIRALALLSAVASAGFAVGLVVGGLVTQIGSWRWVLFINVPFGLAALILAPRYVRQAQRHPARPDLPGAVTACLGVASVVFGLLHAATEGWGRATTVLPLVLGSGLLAIFVVVEARSDQPLLPLRLFADRNRAAAFAMFLVGPAAMMSVFFFLTQFLQDVRGMSALTTGLAFLPMAGGMFAMTRTVPVLLPRFGPKPLSLTGTVLMVAGLIVLTRLSTGSGYWASIAPAMLLLGVGGGLGFVPLTPSVMASVEPRDAGIAGGTLQTMQQVGASLGTAVLVTVFGAAVRSGPSGGPAGPGDAFVRGMTLAFTVAVGIAALGVLIASTFRGVATVRDGAGRER